jgi:hypothetical protein
MVLEAEACAFIGTKYMLFDYPARHWAEHFLSVCSIGTSKLQESVILFSDASRSWGLNCFRFYWLQAEMDLPCPRDFIPFMTACYFRHLISLKTLLRDRVSIESEVGALGLYWASRKGYYDVVDLLL